MCAAARRREGEAYARTQESIAVSGDGESWLLINASPEIRGQIEATPALWPRRDRDSPIAGIALTNGDLDHCLGLLSLRESHPITIHATPAVRDGFRMGNVMYRTLERFPGQVTWTPLELGREQPAPSGLTVTAIATPGKLPLHLEGLRPPSPEDNVGLVIRDQRTGGKLAYFSGIAGASPDVERAVGDADVVMFDGTFWTSDELIVARLATRRAEDMAHWPIGGEGGSLPFLRHLRGRKILIHVNNTNPILREASEERGVLTAAGIEVALDGMELDL
jgi:pyrroloquinoline quinone biosynthesis protein B